MEPQTFETVHGDQHVGSPSSQAQQRPVAPFCTSEEQFRPKDARACVHSDLVNRAIGDFLGDGMRLAVLHCQPP